ncbi:hypothetical protein ACU686_44455, partial [Yinghuangia aomiensis]
MAGTFGGFAATTRDLRGGRHVRVLGDPAHPRIGLLRAVGATPGQIRRMVSAEALLVALAAAASARRSATCSPACSRARCSRHAGRAAPGFALHDGWIPAVVGMGAAVLTTQVAALAAARSAQRRSSPPRSSGPRPGSGGSSVPVLRWLLGLAGIGGGVALLIISLHLSGDDRARYVRRHRVHVHVRRRHAGRPDRQPRRRAGRAPDHRCSAARGATRAGQQGLRPGAHIRGGHADRADRRVHLCTVLFLSTAVATETVAQSKAHATAEFVVDGADRGGLGADAVADRPDCPAWHRRPARSRPPRCSTGPPRRRPSRTPAASARRPPRARPRRRRSATSPSSPATARWPSANSARTGWARTSATRCGVAGRRHARRRAHRR